MWIQAPSVPSSKPVEAGVWPAQPSSEVALWDLSGSSPARVPQKGICVGFGIAFCVWVNLIFPGTIPRVFSGPGPNNKTVLSLLESDFYMKNVYIELHSDGVAQKLKDY